MNRASLMLLTCLAWPAVTLAGPGPLPLDGLLDLAERVAVGKIESINDVQKDPNGCSAGTAIIHVTEMLKGKMPAKEIISVKVYTDIPAEAGRKMASPPRTYKAGDEGIWLVMRSGDLSHSHGLLAKEQLQAVKGALAAIEKRFWAAPVDGLQAWAGFSKLEDTPRLMFAMKNVSDKTVCVPHPDYAGIVTAKVYLPPKGNSLKSVATKDQAEGNKGEAIANLKIAPGETVYMHLAENNMQVILPKVEPGRYVIQMEFNARSAAAPADLPDGAKVCKDLILSPLVEWTVNDKGVTATQPATAPTKGSGRE